MIKKFNRLIHVVWIVLLSGCSSLGAPSSSPKPTEILPSPTVDYSLIGKTSTCPGYLAVINAFYDANDAGRYDVSLGLLKPDAEVVTWGEGVNGRHWDETHLTGMDNIKTVLGKRGFRRNLGQPDGFIYNAADFQITDNQVVFYLRPDRLGAGGRPHNPYMVKVSMDQCKIQSMDVVERFTNP